MIKKFRLLYHTVKYLKATQVFYQLKYRLKKAGFLSDYSKTYAKQSICFLSFMEMPPVYKTYLGRNEFVFLNQAATFGSSIDWNTQDKGKLWNYNLQYANYLLQKDVSLDEKNRLVESMYDWLRLGDLPLEPYPVSLRVINVLRWFSNEGSSIDSILDAVYAELTFLSQRPEYHLLGNHLLENGFALMMGGGFFSNKDWVAQGQDILKKELDEQILSDGAHFELSPMYHQIIFFRLLELIDWYSDVSFKEVDFEEYLKYKAVLMLSWLKNISFENGDIPHFNDSSDGISYSTNWLTGYADRLGIHPAPITLGTSGYRSIRLGKYECKVDLAQLGPSYQPGHAHSDALSFILYKNGEPLFVERGTSTYQIGEIRTLERATSSHNTVVVDGRNQSNVWSAFRVAQRARVIILKDSSHGFLAEHNGYEHLAITHTREINFEENGLNICDEAFGNDRLLKEFHLHVAPGLDVKQHVDEISIENIATLTFNGYSTARIEEFQMADGYNRYRVGKKIVITFVNRLTTHIQLK